jgi:O-antigen/teichoic acid export membrane protein
VGSLRAAQTLLGPLGIVAAAIMSFLLPEVSRRTQLTSRLRLRLAGGVSAGVVVGSLLFAAVLLLIPDGLGTRLLGDTWAGASSVLLPMSLASAAAGASLGPAIVVYAMGQARRTFLLHAFEAPLIIACMATGVVLGGTPGAAWGMAVSMTTMVPLWFWTLHRLLATEGRHATA